MNHVYRLVWSDLHQAFVACAEFVRTRGKRTSATALLSLTLITAPALAADLPTGGQIVAGSGQIHQSGNTLTVTQHSDRPATDWQDFSIGQGHRVDFVQPSASSVALNRVLGSDVSVIQGALNANGQIFLINPNGVLFTPTAQVDVGGLVASTLEISTEDFLNGNYRFSGDSTAAVTNQGQIQAATGGTVALIAARIENTGSIEANGGQVLLGAGRTLTLDLGGPVKLEVEEGALEALIHQGGAIRADGGLVYLTAGAAEELTTAVINHTGITEANALAVDETGEIYLMGDMDQGQLNVAGTLNADGGFVETSAATVKVADGTAVTAGHWLIDPKDYTIAASGGDISGSTLSTSLSSGDVTIASTSGGTEGNGDILVRDDITWSSGNTLTLSAQRNIEVLATLDASGGTGGKVVLEYGQGATDGIIDGTEASYDFGLTGSGFTGKINLQAGNNFSTKLGSGGTAVDYTVITALGAEGSTTGTDLQGIQGNLSGNYVLGADIDASATSGWNSGEGFEPIGNSYSSRFTGHFDGQGHTITDLTINRPSSNYVGLFGRTDSATIRNVGLTGGSVKGKSDVGGLVGYIYRSTVSNSYAAGDVLGSGYYSGGLVGLNYSSSVSNSFYATTDADGNPINNSGATDGVWNGNDQGSGKTSAELKQLATYSGWDIEDAGGTGSLWRIYEGDSYPLLRSFLTPLTITSASSDSKVYDGLAVTSVPAGLFTIGGPYDASKVVLGGDLNGQKNTGDYTASLYSAQQGYDLIGTRSADYTITPKELTASYSAANKVYDGTTAASVSATSSDIISGDVVSITASGAFANKHAGSDKTVTISGGALSGTDAGNYVLQNATGTTTADITRKTLSISGTSVADKVYDGNTNATVTAGSLSGLVGSETLNVSASGEFADKNAGSDKNVTVTYTLSDGSGLADNYTLANESLTASILPRPVTITANDASKVLGQPDPALTWLSGCGPLTAGCGLVAGETLTGSLLRDPGEYTGTFAIEQGSLTGANNPNYAITYIGGELTIEPGTAVGTAADTIAYVQTNTPPSERGRSEQNQRSQPALVAGGSRFGGSLEGDMVRIAGTGIRLPEYTPTDDD